MEASTAREFGEEKTREVGRLVTSMQQLVANVDRSVEVAGGDGYELVPIFIRTEMGKIPGIYGQLVALHGSWTQKTKELE